MFMAVFLELSPRSIQLITPSIFAVNEAMFICKAVRYMEKNIYQAQVKEI